MYLNTVFKYNVFKYCSALNTLSECISPSSKLKIETISIDIEDIDSK